MIKLDTDSDIARHISELKPYIKCPTHGRTNLRSNLNTKLNELIEEFGLAGDTYD